MRLRVALQSLAEPRDIAVVLGERAAEGMPAAIIGNEIVIIGDRRLECGL